MYGTVAAANGDAAPRYGDEVHPLKIPACMSLLAFFAVSSERGLCQIRIPEQPVHNFLHPPNSPLLPGTSLPQGAWQWGPEDANGSRPELGTTPGTRSPKRKAQPPVTSPAHALVKVKSVQPRQGKLQELPYFLHTMPLNSSDPMPLS